jgi:tRNA pseudouridine55 synthase
LNRPNNTSLSGLLLVDKPVGITSFDVIRQLRRTTGIRKIGHAGTLDPLAQGLMIMLFNSACKQAGTYSKLDKCYTAQIYLGLESSTGDREGIKEQISTRQPDLSEVAAAASRLTGSIEQTPSVYSAIKIQGQEAYKRARAGETVAMPGRVVTVYEVRITDFHYPLVTVDYRVSSGTYIRTLAQDLGRLLGTGAYLNGLTRTCVGQFSLLEASMLEGLNLSALEMVIRPA